jgi:hypothetical protein
VLLIFLYGMKKPPATARTPLQQERHPVADPSHDTARGLTAVLGRGRVGGSHQ